MKFRFLISDKITLARVFHLSIFSLVIVISFQLTHPGEIVFLRNITIFSFGWCGLSMLLRRGNFPNTWGMHLLGFCVLLFLTVFIAYMLRIWL